MSVPSPVPALRLWLSDIGLEDYLTLFTENKIDVSILPDLDDQDLQGMGVPLGDRKRILKAIEALNADQSVQPSPFEPSHRTARRPSNRPLEFAGRRQLTVLFADLVDSTVFAERLDPEELGDIMESYQTCCGDIIRLFGGTVARYMGDGVVAYFGYPQAHETDAEQSIRAGLALVAEVSKLTPHDIKLQTRVGIATGLVVVGEIIRDSLASEQAVHGETLNLAQRLQSAALPDTVIISNQTRRLAGGLFDYVDLGPKALKGFSEPLPAWLVTGASKLASRFEAIRGASELTPLIGREEELELLLRRWHQAAEGEGRVVLLAGEAGIGKSRIAETLRKQVEDESRPVLRFFASPNHENSALYPIIDHLRRAANIGRLDSDDEKLDKLIRLLRPEEERLSEVITLIGALLSIPVAHRYPSLNLSAQRQKEKTIEAVVDYLFAPADEGPLLVVFEDLHWMDPSSLQLLDRCIERAHKLPVLIALTYRPEFSAPWSGLYYVATVTLNRLSPSKSREILEKLTGGRSLPEPILTEIIDRCDGVPLYLEETFKAVKEGSVLREEERGFVLCQPHSPLAVPSTLQDSLMSRLDRLGRIKEIAQIGAVIGRQFSIDLLAAVSPLDLDSLTDALDQLTEAELIFKPGQSREAVFIFKHALVQEAAYASLLHSKRRQLHARLAAVLEQRYPERADTEPEVMAQHFTGAGMPEKAVIYWQKAGERANERFANAEAIAHLNRGLEALSSLPETAARNQTELQIQLALGMPLLMTKGHNAPEVETAYSRAKDICQKLGPSQNLFSALVGLWRFFLSQARFLEALALGRQAYKIAQQLREPAMLQEAHMMLGSSRFYMGQPAEAHENLEQATSLLEHTSSRAHAAGRATDPGVMCLSWEGWCLWKLGYPQRAVARCENAIALAKYFAHPYGVSFAQFFAAILYHRCRDVERVAERAQECMALSEEQGFHRWLVGSQILNGWALTQMGEHTRGLEMTRKGVQAWRRAGSLGVPHLMSMLAEVYLEIGDPDQAISTLSECIDIAEGSGELRYVSEFYRLRGEALIRAAALEPEAVSPSERVESDFDSALEIARRQRARMLELRAAVSLGGFWRSTGRADRARQLLTDTTAWFAEGEGGKDLESALALLGALR